MGTVSSTSEGNTESLLNRSYLTLILDTKAVTSVILNAILIYTVKYSYKSSWWLVLLNWLSDYEMSFQ